MDGLLERLRMSWAWTAMDQYGPKEMLKLMAREVRTGGMSEECFAETIMALLSSGELIPMPKSCSPSMIAAMEQWKTAPLGGRSYLYSVYKLAVEHVHGVPASVV